MSNSRIYNLRCRVDSTEMLLVAMVLITKPPCRVSVAQV